MPPRSQDTICLIACPKFRSQYSWTISYSLLSHRGTWAIRWGQGGKGVGSVSRTWGGKMLRVQAELAEGV